LEKSRARIVVSGEVQGVGYRSFALFHGRALGLHGYVRNAFDGTVVLEVEGERGTIEGLIEHLRQGPRAARVADVEVEWRDSVAEFDGFEVKF
jgi:acylphosphatase